MTAITYKKLRNKLMKKTLEPKKTIELIKQNTYEKKNKENTIPWALISAKGKHTIKEKPILRMEKFGARPKTRTTRNRPCRLCRASNWTPLYKHSAIKTNYNKIGREGHYAMVYTQKYTNNGTVKKKTTTETKHQVNRKKEYTISRRKRN